MTPARAARTLKHGAHGGQHCVGPRALTALHPASAHPRTRRTRRPAAPPPPARAAPQATARTRPPRRPARPAAVRGAGRPAARRRPGRPAARPARPGRPARRPPPRAARAPRTAAARPRLRAYRHGNHTAISANLSPPRRARALLVPHRSALPAHIPAVRFGRCHATRCFRMAVHRSGMLRRGAQRGLHKRHRYFRRSSCRACCVLKGPVQENTRTAARAGERHKCGPGEQDGRVRGRQGLLAPAQQLGVNGGARIGRPELVRAHVRPIGRQRKRGVEVQALQQQQYCLRAQGRRESGRDL